MLPNIYRKTFAPESIFIKVKTPAHVFSCEFFKSIKGNILIKHLRATASECWRLEKSSWLLVEDIILQLFGVSYFEW